MRYKIEIRPLEIAHLKQVYEMGIEEKETIEAIEPQSLTSFDWTPEMLAKAYANNENLQLGAFIKKKLIGYLIALQLEKDAPIKILGMGVIKKFCNSEFEEVEHRLLVQFIELAKGKNVVAVIPDQNEYLLSIFKKINFTRTRSISEMKLMV